MSKTTKPSKAELIATLVAAGKGTEPKLRRHSLAKLEAMAAPPRKQPKPEKPTAQAALGRVADLLGLTLGEVAEMRSYSRAAATNAEGGAFTLYRNATNVGVVPKGVSRDAAREQLAKFQKVAGGTVRATKAELLVPDEAVAS